MNGVRGRLFVTYVLRFGETDQREAPRMSIGTRIIQLRNEKRLTQQDLSDRTGLAASYLSRIENRHLEPRPHTLRKIALALGVPMSEIFQERSTQLGTLQCVITSSGNCIMNLLHSGQGKRVQSHGKVTTPGNCNCCAWRTTSFKPATSGFLTRLTCCSAPY